MKRVTLPDVEKEMARLEEKEIQEAIQIKRGMMAEKGSSSPLLCNHRPHERETIKIGRNDPCPCGSGKKSKKCCPPKVKYKEKS